MLESSCAEKQVTIVDDCSVLPCIILPVLMNVIALLCCMLCALASVKHAVQMLLTDSKEGMVLLISHTTHSCTVCCQALEPGGEGGIDQFRHNSTVPPPEVSLPDISSPQAA